MSAPEATSTPTGDTAQVKRKRGRPIYRAGGLTNAERATVAAFVKDSPSELRAGQVQALSELLRRPVGTVKAIIQEARESLASDAKLYVETHRMATIGAMASGDFKVAAEAAQWAMKNIGEGDVRIIDREVKPSDSGSRVLIGIKLGGIGAPIVETPALPEPESNGGSGN